MTKTKALAAASIMIVTTAVYAADPQPPQSVVQQMQACIHALGGAK
jgi:hypothetical protein